MAWTCLGLTLPLALAWDGVVSCARTHSVEELLAAGRESAPGYEWTSGRYQLGLLPVWISYVVGVPGPDIRPATMPSGEFRDDVSSLFRSGAVKSA